MNHDCETTGSAHAFQTEAQRLWTIRLITVEVVNPHRKFVFSSWLAKTCLGAPFNSTGQQIEHGGVLLEGRDYVRSKRSLPSRITPFPLNSCKAKLN